MHADRSAIKFIAIWDRRTLNVTVSTFDPFTGVTFFLLLVQRMTQHLWFSVLNFKIAKCLQNAILNIQIDKLIFIFRY